MDLISLLIEHPYFDAISVAFITYFVRLFLSPSKYEAKIAGKVVTLVAIMAVNLLKRWYLKHPKSVIINLDKVYAHVFHSRHYFVGTEGGKIIAG